MKKQESNSRSVTEVITDAIIAQLEKGVIPWEKSWINSCKNAVSRKDYRGINRLITSMTMVMKEFKCPYFATYNQIKDLGGHVKRGAHGIPIIFWKVIDVKSVSEELEITEKNIPMMRYFTVFNLDQCQGIDMSKFQMAENQNDPIETAEQVVNNWKDKPENKRTGTQPCYLPQEDKIEIPDIAYFKSSESFYSTLFHEMIHSTGHTSRLNREEVVKLTFFGTESYAIEELVAELGSSFICSHTGIERIIENAASYIQSWLKALKNDRRQIITASARAEKAMQYIIGGGLNDNQSL